MNEPDRHRLAIKLPVAGLDGGDDNEDGVQDPENGQEDDILSWRIPDYPAARIGNAFVTVMTSAAAGQKHPPTDTASPTHHDYLEALGKIYFYVYASEASRPFSPEELRELLVTSRRNNAALGLSGMLLYKAGCFLQVLEGSKAAVYSVLEKISRDPRHRDVMKISEGFENEYQFPDWTMGFHDLDSAEAKATPGYSEFLNQPLNMNAFSSDATLGQRMLLAFKKAV